MAPIIERIENAGPDNRARRLVFSDFEEPRLTSAAVVRVLGLDEGDDVDLVVLEARLGEQEESCAHERALRMLGYRDRSSGELAKRLRQDGYPQSVVEPLVARLVELGFVDDARFAAGWARTRTQSGFGPERIRRELAQKGVGEDVADQALRDVTGEHDQAERARALLGSAVLETRADRDRAVRKLVRKGFDLRTALRATERDSD